MNKKESSFKFGMDSSNREEIKKNHMRKFALAQAL